MKVFFLYCIMCPLYILGYVYKIHSAGLFNTYDFMGNNTVFHYSDCIA